MKGANVFAVVLPPHTSITVRRLAELEDMDPEAFISQVMMEAISIHESREVEAPAPMELLEMARAPAH